MAESLFRATEEEKLEILSKYQAFVFDMDGTLWRGTQLIAGAAEVLDLLRYQVLARGGLDRFHACMLS
jgi:phosphoglycolate phosphatase-like HAD superfamily hydrolase